MFLCFPLLIVIWLMQCVQSCTILLLVAILVSGKCTASVKKFLVENNAYRHQYVFQVVCGVLSAEELNLGT